MELCVLDAAALLVQGDISAPSDVDSDSGCAVQATERSLSELKDFAGQLKSLPQIQRHIGVAESVNKVGWPCPAAAHTGLAGGLSWMYCSHESLCPAGKAARMFVSVLQKMCQLTKAGPALSVSPCTECRTSLLRVRGLLTAGVGRASDADASRD